jgi:cytochrome c553
MKKLVAVMAGVMLMGLSAAAFAEEEVNVGEQIYKKALGRGCGACHETAGNPNLPENIRATTLTRDGFEKVIREGRGGMPKAMEAIMAVGAVKKANLTETQALDAIFDYLKTK